ncbi:hypothetical protein DFH09DRAFT_939077 [Mycena vulgaris]|nr:hypothetical protein DFH09DRAFT_939077 [Mycena vulgaris]
MAGNRHHIPEEQKRLVVIMASKMKPKDITAATNIDICTVYRILELWRDTRKCMLRLLELGRPHILTALDVSSLEGLVLRTPDIYTFKLQRFFFVHTGLDFDKETIHRVLIRRGYMRKTVRESFWLC